MTTAIVGVGNIGDAVARHLVTARQPAADEAGAGLIWASSAAGMNRFIWDGRFDTPAKLEPKSRGRACRLPGARVDRRASPPNARCRSRAVSSLFAAEFDEGT